jgi:phage-related tail fiber protein
MYSYSGLTQSAKLLGSVQGVLVHANKNVLGSSLHSNDTTIDGSFTSCSKGVLCTDVQLCSTVSSVVSVSHAVTPIRYQINQSFQRVIER